MGEPRSLQTRADGASALEPPARASGSATVWQPQAETFTGRPGPRHRRFTVTVTVRVPGRGLLLPLPSRSCVPGSHGGSHGLPSSSS
eukprot:2205599-Rhodomonas_salina.1